jgi:hypothetical protein
METATILASFVKLASGKRRYCCILDRLQSLSLTGSVGYLSKQLTGGTRTEFKALGWPTSISNIPIKAGVN